MDDQSKPQDTAAKNRIHDSGQRINVVGNVQGSGNRILQVYAPGSAPLEPERFVRVADAKPFSTEWLLFSQESVPLVGRAAEREEILQFLDHPAPFSWWAITGSGGNGKSRLMLDFLKDLPDTWQGGFVPQRNFNVRDTATWRPHSHMLWVIDDAASAGAELSHMIGVWAQLHHESPYKVRVLLLERAYNEAAGWWAELTQDPSPRTAAVINTLFAMPCDLAPLGDFARTFLAAVRDELDPESSAQLESALAAMGEAAILQHSQGGNPLLLSLLAAEILSGDISVSGAGLDKNGLAERHLAREIDRLHAHCEAAQLRFGIMLELLFLTTSSSPIDLLLDNDHLLLTGNDEVLLVTGADGLKRIPTIAELREMGVDIEGYRRPMLDALCTILEVDDIEAYLSVLDDIGLGARRYAIEPDLIAAVLFNLMFNSTEVPASLKRRRGEFDAARLMRLITGALEISRHGAWAHWARLSDRTLNQLVLYVRDLGNSIRWPMLVTRELNRRRSGKIPIDLERLFSSSKRHANAADVGRYFSSLRSAIASPTIDDATIAALAASPHCWTAHYADVLLDLAPLERLHLGLIICAVADDAVLGRLTNLDNFLSCVRTAMADASQREHEGRPVDAETAALDRLVDGVIDFATTRAWPAIIRANDPEYASVYQAFARALTTASFIIANGLRGRVEDSVTRWRALIGLDFARKALAVAPSPADLQYVDRNATILRSHEIREEPEVVSLFIETLKAMQPYADAEAYTGAISDFLHLIEARSSPHMIGTLAAILDNAPARLILAEDLVWRVLDLLTTFADTNAADDDAATGSLARTFLRYFADRMRMTEDADAANAIAQFCSLIANAATDTGQQEEAARLLVDLHRSLAVQPPSEIFLRALLKGVQTVRHILRVRKSPADALIPFETHFVSYGKAELERLAANDSERTALEGLASLTAASSVYELDGKHVRSSGFMMDLAPGHGETDVAATEALARLLLERMHDIPIPGWTVSDRTKTPPD